MRCLHVSSLVRAELVQEIEQDGVIVRTAMSRGRGIVEMFTAETVPCFDWQIQEGQYRLVYLTGCARGPGPTRREARAYSGYFCFDQARTVLGDTGPERPVTAPNAPLAFGGFASDFVYRIVPAQDWRSNWSSLLGITSAWWALSWHTDAWGKGHVRPSAG